MQADKTIRIKFRGGVVLGDKPIELPSKSVTVVSVSLSALPKSLADYIASKLDEQDFGKVYGVNVGPTEAC